MNTFRRILALIGAALLLLMYILTMVFAASNNPNAKSMLMASIACTIIVPVIIYAFTLITKNLKGKGDASIRNIVFDFGNVLLPFEQMPFLERHVEDPAVRERLMKAIFQNPAWGEADRGYDTEEETVQKYIAADPEMDEEIRKVWVHIGDTIHMAEFAIPWLTSLKNRGYKLYGLSNYSRGLFEKTKDKMKYLPLLDGLVISFEVHMVKPEPRIYQYLCSRYGLDPKHTIFIDDLPANLDAAADRGFHTLLFRNYEEANQQLEEALLTYPRH